MHNKGRLPKNCFEGVPENEATASVFEGTLLILTAEFSGVGTSSSLYFEGITKAIRHPSVPEPYCSDFLIQQK